MNQREIECLFRRFESSPLLLRKIKGRAVGLFLLPDSEMKRLKKAFLPREKGPPNVLAFPEPEQWRYHGTKRRPLGEIYLNKKLARGGAAPRLILHGLLHLLGYDHKGKRDRIRMEKLENRIIKKLGY